MSFHLRHFLDFSNLRREDILSFFKKVEENQDRFFKDTSKSIAFLFLENSTRTVASFELACRDLGYYPLKISHEVSSLKKGESFLDTLLTLEALGVSAFVVRHGLEFSLKELSDQIKTPLINAGEGVMGHPTQALLDAYTLLQARGRVQGERVLIVGDVKYSRVARSNLELLTLLGAEVAYCGPQNLLPQDSQKVFSELSEGMEWATAIMVLRPQLERHAQGFFEAFRKDYIRDYGLSFARLESWKKEGIVLHPGPFIRDQEIESSVIQDSRCKVWDQVQNGRLIRKTLLGLILGDIELAPKS